MEEILKTIDLTKTFGGLVAVGQVNFSIKKGDLQTIIGPNGAGKSTFFKLITGEIKPSKGQIIFLNKISPLCPKPRFPIWVLP